MSSSAYHVLGLEEDAKLSIKEIHDAYHSLAREYHPDKNLTTPDESKAKFQAIQEAYTAILRESTLDGIDGEADQTLSKSKLAKPWAPKRGRKFDHRAMQEVEDLKEKVAKAAAQRAIDEVAEQEDAQRPKQKKRAKQWEKEKKKLEVALAREKEAARKIEARQALTLVSKAHKAENLRKQEETRKSANKTPEQTNKNPETETSLILLPQKSLILSSGTHLASFLNSRPDAIIKEPQVGSAPSVARQIQDELVALMDAETSKSEEAVEMKFEIPEEFIHASTDLHIEDDPELFIERSDMSKSPHFVELLSDRFPELADLIEESGGDIENILKKIKQEKKEREVERKRLREQEEEKNKIKVAAFEKYWANKKVVETSAPVIITPKKERRLGRKEEKQARDFNRAHLAHLASQPMNASDNDDSQLLAIKQETIESTKWSKDAVFDPTVEDDFDTDPEAEHDDIPEETPEYLWEQETFSEFQRNHDKVDQVQLAMKMRRGAALVTALEYRSGLLLTEDSHNI